MKQLIGRLKEATLKETNISPLGSFGEAPQGEDFITPYARDL